MMGEFQAYLGSSWHQHIRISLGLFRSKGQLPGEYDIRFHEGIELDRIRAFRPILVVTFFHTDEVQK